MIRNLFLLPCLFTFCCLAIACGESTPVRADAAPSEETDAALSQECNFQNCQGCCRGSQCIETPSNDNCGQAGSACEACASSDTCIAGTCTPDTGDCADCDGCCYEGEQCLTGTWRLACGSDGNACVACPEGQGCANGECQEIACDATNCDGCCTVNGDCILDAQQSKSACGKNGAACNVCDESATSCTQGTCVTEQRCLDFCEDGCCTAQGQCIPFSEQDPNTCGAGAVCSGCADGLSCLAGDCIEDSVWSLRIVSAVLSPQNAEGEDWDQAIFTDPLPDAYVAGALGEDIALDWTTATIDNTLTPRWNEIKDSYLQSDLLAEGFFFEIRDADGLGVFETMSSCRVSIDQADLSAGQKLIATCGRFVTDLSIEFRQQ